VSIHYTTDVIGSGANHVRSLLH